MQRFDPALALMTEDELLAEIEQVRVRNNTLWMMLVRMAVRDPDGRRVLKEISGNDQRIRDLTAELVK